jgi:hypothetical protein
VSNLVQEWHNEDIQPVPETQPSPQAQSEVLEQTQVVEGPETVEEPPNNANSLQNNPHVTT